MTRYAALPLPKFCERFGVGHTKVYEEINAGRLRAVKLGTRTLITEDAAQEWLASLPVVEPKNAA